MPFDIYSDGIDRPSARDAAVSTLGMLSAHGLQSLSLDFDEALHRHLWGDMVKPEKSTGKINRKLMALIRKAGLNVTYDAAPMGEAYLSHNNTIIRRHSTTPDTLAHELGHAVSLGGVSDRGLLSRLFAKPWGSLQNLSRSYHNAFVGSGPGRMATLLSGTYLDTPTLGYLGALMSAPTLPMLAEELNASRIGYNTLRKIGAGRFKALGAFSGVPSYIASAAVPVMPWVARKVDEAVKGDS